jgi:hypothetical protein
MQPFHDGIGRSSAGTQQKCQPGCSGNGDKTMTQKGFRPTVIEHDFSS